jgi:hypothetical protein
VGHTNTYLSVDVCSSPRIVQVVLLPFDSLFDSTLQGTRSRPGQPFPFCVLCKTVYQIHMHIQSNTSSYTHINADISIYIHIDAYTYIIQAIKQDTNSYMYIHTQVCIAYVLYVFECIV